MRLSHAYEECLAPPFAGRITFAHVRASVTVTTESTNAELVAATRVMYERGFVCETSGCAGLAAAMANKLGPAKRVVCVVSGRNISMEDMQHEMGAPAENHNTPCPNHSWTKRFLLMSFCLGFGLRHLSGLVGKQS